MCGPNPIKLNGFLRTSDSGTYIDPCARSDPKFTGLGMDRQPRVPNGIPLYWTRIFISNSTQLHRRRTFDMWLGVSDE